MRGIQRGPNAGLDLKRVLLDQKRFLQCCTQYQGGLTCAHLIGA